MQSRVHVVIVIVDLVGLALEDFALPDDAFADIFSINVMNIAVVGIGSEKHK